jgi:hypothetical protein
MCLAVLGLIALAVPALSSAAEPTVSITKFTAKAIPVPKQGGGSWAGTGNILGHGAAVEASYEIAGEGYGATSANPKGGIAPISQVNFYLPAGAKLHPAGFGNCTEATLKNIGASGCPKSSVASPIGSVLGEVTFGTERVPEETELRAFFGEGGLLFYTVGHSPVSLEIVSKGKYRPSHQPPYGEELETLVPPVATVPGAPLASVKTINIKAGAAIKKGKSIISYGTLPTKCKGGLPVKTEIIFGGANQYGNFGIPAKTATATYKAPCPRKH